MPDRKISRLIATMRPASQPKMARLMGMLVANGIVDLGLRFELEDDKSGKSSEMTVAEAVGRGSIANPAHIMQLVPLIGEQEVCRFFDWSMDGEHVASSAIKGMASSDAPAHKRGHGQTISKGRQAPTAAMDEWVGLLCRNRDPLAILDDAALSICMSAKMPRSHESIAAKVPVSHRLSGGERLWSHARSSHQFDLLACNTHAMADLGFLIEISDACEAKRAGGKPSAFAARLDTHLLEQAARSVDGRDWVNRRVDAICQGKKSKWIENEQVLAWVGAWLTANPGQEMSEAMRMMLLDRRNADSKSILEHYAAILKDDSVFQAVGAQAMGERLLEIGYQRFRSKGNTATLAAVARHIGWPRHDVPHVVRLGLAPCGGEKSVRKESLSKLAEILNQSGAQVWGDDLDHTAGQVMGAMHQVIIGGGDKGPGGSTQECLATLAVVLDGGVAGNEALRFCGALARYVIVQQSPQADRCLQDMVKTASHAGRAVDLAGGKALHEMLDEIAGVFRNSKKREPFAAFRSMVGMSAATHNPGVNKRGPRL